MVYDPFSERYLALSVDNLPNPIILLLAASKTSDPTQGWTGFSIKTPTEQRTADFPTLGFNSQGVYVSATTNTTPVQTPQISNLLVVPKADLLAAVPTIVNATPFADTRTGFATQPAIDLDNQRLSATLLHSSPGATNQLLRVDVVGDIRSPVLTSPAPIQVSQVFPIDQVLQPPPGLTLDHMNRNGLATNLVIQNNSLWGVQTVRDNGQAALRWFQVDLNTNKVLQEDLIKRPGLNFFYGSIAVNKAGDVVIGFSGSGPSQFASAYAVAGSPERWHDRIWRSDAAQARGRLISGYAWKPMGRLQCDDVGPFQFQVLLDNPRVGLRTQFMVHSNYGNWIRLCYGGSGTELARALWQRTVGPGMVAAVAGIVIPDHHNGRSGSGSLIHPTDSVASQVFDQLSDHVYVKTKLR